MSLITQDYGAIGTDVQTQMLIAPVLAEMKADRQFAVGDQFIVDSVLYKITTAISVIGTPLVVGTNCEVSDSITQQIKQFKSGSPLNRTLSLDSGATSATFTSNVATLTQVGDLCFVVFHFNCTLNSPNSSALRFKIGGINTIKNVGMAFPIEYYNLNILDKCILQLGDETIFFANQTGSGSSIKGTDIGSSSLNVYGAVIIVNR